MAEEVTLTGGYERRPDIVRYLNGLAIAVIELKRGSVELAGGVRQLITNQEAIFNKGFFSTAQLLLAGSDSQGVRFGTKGTPERIEVRVATVSRACETDRPLCSGDERNAGIACVSRSAQRSRCVLPRARRDAMPRHEQE